jgi:hypothetical protein
MGNRTDLPIVLLVGATAVAAPFFAAAEAAAAENCTYMLGVPVACARAETGPAGGGTHYAFGNGRGTAMTGVLIGYLEHSDGEYQRDSRGCAGALACQPNDIYFKLPPGVSIRCSDAEMTIRDAIAGTVQARSSYPRACPSFR